jgi:hypothetical protein
VRRSELIHVGAPLCLQPCALEIAHVRPTRLGTC